MSEQLLPFGRGTIGTIDECGKKNPHLGFFDSKKPHWGLLNTPRGVFQKTPLGFFGW
jgi:hypothetical protein